MLSSPESLLWSRDANNLIERAELTNENLRSAETLIGRFVRDGWHGTTRDLHDITVDRSDQTDKFNPEENFILLAVDNEGELDLSSPLAEAVSEKITELVISQPAADIMVLPEYDSSTPLGNGMLLAHSMRHVSHRKLGERRPFGSIVDKDTYDEETGEHEILAYSLNWQLLCGVAGSDVCQEYIDGLKGTVVVPKATKDEYHFSFEPKYTENPLPKGTALEEFDIEGGMSRQLIDSIIAHMLIQQEMEHAGYPADAISRQIGRYNNRLQTHREG